MVHYQFGFQQVPFHSQALGDFSEATGKCRVSETINDSTLHAADRDEALLVDPLLHALQFLRCGVQVIFFAQFVPQIETYCLIKRGKFASVLEMNLA
mgnify:FL=1